MKLKTKAKWTGVVLTAPYLAGFFLLFVIPFLISVTYTFTRGVGAMEFVGWPITRMCWEAPPSAWLSTIPSGSSF